MRDLGMKEPPAWYVTQDEEDYYMHTGKLSKALAANAANADLNGIRVPVDKMMVVIRKQKVML